MDVLTWDERSVLVDRGFLPPVRYDRLDRPGPDIDLVDRYRGALLGLAVGDALGKPVETLGPDEVAARHGRVNRYLSAPHAKLLLPPGQLGDDTQLMLALASGAITKGRFEPRDFAQRLMAWLPIARGAGEAVSDAARALRNGMPWANTGQDSAGRGALARSVAAALIMPFDLDGIRTNAALHTVATHANHSAIAASVATAATVAHLLTLEPGTFQSEGLITTIVRALEDVADPTVRLRGHGGQTSVMDRVQMAIESPHLSASEAYTTFGNSGFALETLPMALWAFASQAESPVAPVILGVNAGGAASTIGALAGAFSGAYHGATSWPSAWIDHLEYVDGIAGHADGLAALAGVDQPRSPFREFDVLRPEAYAPFSLGGTVMPTLEHAIRSASAPDPTMAVKVRLVPTPADARRYATLSPQRPDWEAVAHGTVAAILKRRFAEHDPARDRLDQATPHDLQRATALFADEPFDYRVLLEAQRASLAQTR